MLYIFIIIATNKLFSLKKKFAYFFIAIICFSSIDLIIQFTKLANKANIELSEHKNETSNEDNQNYEKDFYEKDKILGFRIINPYKSNKKQTQIKIKNQYIYPQNHPSIIEQPPKA